MGDPEASFEKPSVKNMICYTEGGYFGDCDIFAQSTGVTSVSDGRDMGAVGEVDCSIFVLHHKEIDKIRENFMSIYKEMEKRAMSKFKYH